MKDKSLVRILVVDDSQSSRDVLEDLISSEGYETRMAADGLEAIKILETEQVDMVLTDLMMPGADGMEVLKRAIRINPEIPVVIITGYASLDTAIEAMKCGAYGYIKKPFKLDEMLLLIRNAAERIRLIRENRELIKHLSRAQEELKQLRSRKQELDQEMRRVTKEIKRYESLISSSLNSLDRLPANLLPYSTPRGQPGSKAELLEELNKLGRLRKEKVIDEDEFRVCKAKLLSRL